MKILILGASGMIGHKLWHKLSLRFDDVYAVIHRKREHFSRTGLLNSDRVFDCINVEHFHFLDELMKDLCPQVILNCIGITKRHPESDDPIRCLTLNSLLPHRLAKWGERNGARIFQFSTDCVFDGKTGSYTDVSPPSAIDLYGRTKALGEIHGKNALTLRTSAIGRELTSFTELLEWFLAQRGKTVKGFCNAMYTGVTTLFLSTVVGDIIEFHPSLNGIYQLAGPVISKFDLLCLARDVFDLDIEVIPDKEFVCNRTLIGSRFESATGIVAPSWAEMMHELFIDGDVYNRIAH